MTPEALRPNFSVFVYFFSIFVIMVIGSVAFYFIDRQAQQTKSELLLKKQKEVSFNSSPDSTKENDLELDRREKNGQLESEKLMNSDAGAHDTSKTRPKSDFEKYSLLLVLFLTCLLIYGVLPSLVSYSKSLNSRILRRAVF